MDALKLIEKTAQKQSFLSSVLVIRLRYQLISVRAQERESRCLRAQ